MCGDLECLYKKSYSWKNGLSLKRFIWKTMVAVGVVMEVK